MTIPAVDPRNPLRGPDPAARAVAAFARTPVGRWLGVNLVAKVDPTLLRVTRGRLSLFGVYRTVLLTVPGRTSGIPRTVPLLYFTEGADVVVMASSFGRVEYPAWYFNVKAHPEVTLTANGRDHPHVARELEGEEWDAAFDSAVLLFAGFADYRDRVTAAGRHLPILRLSPTA